MTDRAQYRFIVKETGDGKPWIALEPLERELSGEGLPRGIFGFDLPVGTTYDQAKETARYLDKHLAKFTFTRF
jgi:hypothetical protein